MPIFFDENDLSEDQRGRYAWAVLEYQRIQRKNRERFQGADAAVVQHGIGPQSALFARLLDGKQALPYPPPTSFDYPWYDIIEKPGQYQVTVGAPWTTVRRVQQEDRLSGDAHIVLNQCSWTVVRANQAGKTFLDFLKLVTDPRNVPAQMWESLLAALASQPEIIVTFGQWGEFRLFLGRIIRRGRRQIAVANRFDIDTLEGGNPEIVKVLHPGAALRAKSDATLALVRNRQGNAATPLSAFEQITLASESAMAFGKDPEDDDLVEYDCDGWVLERM